LVLDCLPHGWQWLHPVPLESHWDRRRWRVGVKAGRDPQGQGGLAPISQTHRHRVFQEAGLPPHQGSRKTSAALPTACLQWATSVPCTAQEHCTTALACSGCAQSWVPGPSISALYFISALPCRPAVILCCSGCVGFPEFLCVLPLHGPLFWDSVLHLPLCSFLLYCSICWMPGLHWEEGFSWISRTEPPHTAPHWRPLQAFYRNACTTEYFDSTLQ
jgi:hypothetical protein